MTVAVVVMTAMMMTSIVVLVEIRLKETTPGITTTAVVGISDREQPVYNSSTPDYRSHHRTNNRVVPSLLPRGLVSNPSS